MHWFQLLKPAPLLNTPDYREVFGGVSGGAIPLNTKGLPYHFEFVGLAGMSFRVLQEDGHILEVLAEDYGQKPLYVDGRFGEMVFLPGEKKKEIPNRVTLLERMEKRIGTPYVWGGNWADGIPEMLQYYPSQKTLDQKTLQLWTFKGLDCSGLLFEASHGSTPRNTDKLVHFGTALPIAFLPIEKVLSLLLPMDMVVYPGHVLFVRDSATAIESRFPLGVQIVPLKERLEEILQSRSLVNRWPPQEPHKSFIIRRFAQ